MNYWVECIACSLDEHGVKATQEQIEAIAADVEVSHENFGMAHGYDCIPNPLHAEIAERDERIKRIEKERDCAELDFKKNVAMRHNCEITDVVLTGDGHARVY